MERIDHILQENLVRLTLVFFEVLKRVGNVAYELDLPPHLQHIHNVFHVSGLKKYNPYLNHVIGYESIEIQPYLS